MHISQMLPALLGVLLGLPNPFTLPSIPNLGLGLVAIELAGEHSRVFISSSAVPSFEKKFGKDSEQTRLIKSQLESAISRRDELEKRINDQGDEKLRKKADGLIQDALAFQKELSTLSDSDREKRLKQEYDKAKRELADLAVERERLMRIRDKK